MTMISASHPGEHDVLWMDLCGGAGRNLLNTCIQRSRPNSSLRYVVLRLENLAMVSFCEGKHKEAEKMWCQAHDVLVRSGRDPFDPAVSRIISNIAVSVCKDSKRKF
jgi:hypothetical protein